MTYTSDQIMATAHAGPRAVEKHGADKILDAVNNGINTPGITRKDVTDALLSADPEQPTKGFFEAMKEKIGSIQLLKPRDFEDKHKEFDEKATTRMGQVADNMLQEALKLGKALQGSDWARDDHGTNKVATQVASVDKNQQKYVESQNPEVKK